MSLKDKVRTKTLPTSSRGPVWEGPESDGQNGGITFSLLSRFLSCRERFRILTVEGFKLREGFNQRLEYGNMWHLCEEVYALEGVKPVNEKLLNYCKGLLERYPTDGEQINKWYNVCKRQFPVYVAYWSKHPDVQERRPLLQEEAFRVPYTLPSGRTVFLRGKWDSVDLVGEGRTTGIWLQENKTKGDIDESRVARQLTFDLQTMLYMVALWAWRGNKTVCDVYANNPDLTIKGVRYNVIRRPLSGGRHTIVQHKPSKSNPAGESTSAYYDRLGGLIEEDPGYFFMRWNVEVTPGEVDQFRERCLDPILESLCNWWHCILNRPMTGKDYDNLLFGLHYQHPFGVYNPMDEGRASDLDNYILTGSEVGLERVENLFPELS